MVLIGLNYSRRSLLVNTKEVFNTLKAALKLRNGFTLSLHMLCSVGILFIDPYTNTSDICQHHLDLVPSFNPPPPQKKTFQRMMSEATRLMFQKLAAFYPPRSSL